MKIKIFTVVLVMGMLFSGMAFAWGKKAPKHPLDRYDHEMHNGIFEGTVECTHCHLKDAYDRAGILANWREKGMVGCHDCHHPDTVKPIMPVPKDCHTCHEKLPKPTTHVGNWKVIHQSIAKQDERACFRCHREVFCVDCHARRDTIQTRMHDRNFRLYHSIEARANPARCESCHRLNFCTGCHAAR